MDEDALFAFTDGGPAPERSPIRSRDGLAPLSKRRRSATQTGRALPAHFMGRVIG
jgi:hypothetical protein